METIAEYQHLVNHIINNMLDYYDFKDGYMLLVEQDGVYLCDYDTKHIKKVSDDSWM